MTYVTNELMKRMAVDDASELSHSPIKLVSQCASSSITNALPMPTEKKVATKRIRRNSSKDRRRSAKRAMPHINGVGVVPIVLG